MGSFSIVLIQFNRYSLLKNEASEMVVFKCLLKRLKDIKCYSHNIYMQKLSSYIWARKCLRLIKYKTLGRRGMEFLLFYLLKHVDFLNITYRSKGPYIFFF